MPCPLPGRARLRRATPAIRDLWLLAGAVPGRSRRAFLSGRGGCAGASGPCRGGSLGAPFWSGSANRHRNAAEPGPGCFVSAGDRIPEDRGAWSNSCALACSSAVACQFEDNMSQLTDKFISRLAVILILLGTFMVLVALTNPYTIGMATAAFLVGVAMIAVASFAGL